jgi:mannose-1-phosphate guanylyltransferase
VLPDGLVFVMNGDSFVNADLGAYCEWHCRQAAQASLLLVQVKDTSRYGTVETDERDHVGSFREKEGIRKSGWINAGVYLFPCTWIAELTASRPLSLEREVLPEWARRGLWVYRSREAFIDIGTPRTLASASSFFEGLKRIPASARIGSA